MKLASYLHDNTPCYGAVTGEGIIDLSRRIGARYPDLRALLADGGLEEARKAGAGQSPDLKLVEVTLLPVIPNPGKIFCIGLNYDDHRKEGKHEKTEAPAVFVRFAESQVAHGQPMLRPRESHKFDYEGEIALIIGKSGRRISEQTAWDYVAGYSCYNDGSVRDWQHATTQWTAGKNFAATGSFGPWMVTADEIPPGTVLTLSTRLNGVEMQRSTTEFLIHSIPRLISHLSTWIPLAPGDVIVSGTPGGVGARRDPPVWMKPGDVVEIEVDKVGVLRNTIADD
ncbi:MAG: fumarylacetoacetate hydrolase family protein [Proteobacteria bacterium]|nr:fumarylacetoacetate hydrolase family protein [Pseudomonadota bacterium]